MLRKWFKTINSFGGVLLIVTLVYCYAANRVLTQAFFDDAVTSSAEVVNPSPGNHHNPIDLQNSILNLRIHTSLTYSYWIVLTLALIFSIALLFFRLFFTRGPPFFTKGSYYYLFNY